MADTKLNYSSVHELNVYLSFHLVGDNTYPTQKKFITSLLETQFGAEFCDLIHEDPTETGEREVIFSVKRPLMEAPSYHREYFEKLKVVFDQAQRYLPSFTQGLEQK